MQLTMEPLDEMVASARAMDEAGLDTIWLAEGYPWWRKHGMEAPSPTVASAGIAGATRRPARRWGGPGRAGAADDRLGDHLAVHTAPRAGGHGRARRAGGGRARTLHPRL